MIFKLVVTPSMVSSGSEQSVLAPPSFPSSVSAIASVSAPPQIVANEEENSVMKNKFTFWKIAEAWWTMGFVKKNNPE